MLVACATPPVPVVEPEPLPPAETPTDSGSLAPTPTPEPVIIVEPCPITLDEMLLVGEVEHVLVGTEQILLQARIDTGAKTTSLDVSNIEYFERDGERWVQFAVANPSTEVSQILQRPFKRRVRIKRHGDDAQPRPVVALTISMGDLSREVEVSLTDRSGFRYPVLIGRNFLDGEALVDVSRKFVATDSD